MTKREQLQRNGLNAWARNKFFGVLQWATGVGKSYAAILAIKHVVTQNKQAKILIVAPTHEILQNFKKEFTKFKQTSLLKSCKFICYASLTKETTMYD